MSPLAPLRLIVAALPLLASGWLGWTWRDHSAEAELAKCQRVHVQAQAAASLSAQRAEANYRAREAQTHKLQTEAIDAALQNARAAHADADRLRVVIDRLRHPAAPAPRGGEPTAHPTLTSPGAPAIATKALPADLFWGLAEMAGDIGAHADLARIAGLACERAYDALSAHQTTP